MDIDPKTYNIDPAKIEAAVTEKTKAIIPVHLYGQMADMEPIAEIAKKHNLAIIEDAAQAIGSKYKGKNVGELGTTATYSFFPTKNLGGYGDGGMIITNDDDIAETMRVIRVHGSKPKYYHHILGYNSRLDELQAGILNVKFPHLNTWSEARREKAAVYTELLNEKLGDLVVTPFVEEHNYHVFHQYTIQVPDRSGLQEFLKEKGIGSMIYYPKPLHLQPVFSELGYKEGDLPETEKAAETVLSLPMFPELKREQQEYVVEQIAAYFSNHPAKAKKKHLTHNKGLGEKEVNPLTVCQGRNVVIGEHVQLGENVMIGHNVVIYDGVTIGDNCIIQDNAVIGKQPARAKNSALPELKTLPPAQIGSGVTIGTNSIIYASAELGDDVFVADLATVRERVTVGEKTIIGRGAAVENDCVIGVKCKIETNAYITAYSELEDLVFIAPAVVTTNDNYMARSKERFKHFKGVTVKKEEELGPTQPFFLAR